VIRLMLVDDEPNILASLRRVIAAMPAEDFGGRRPQVECFTSTSAALERARSVPFDLVVSDYRMPELDGVTFLSRMIELQPDVARLILSGYADITAVIEAINRTQIFRFIGKPWNDFDVQSGIVLALKQRNLLLDNRRLADEVRVMRGQLSRQEHMLRQLEARSPGLTKVNRNADGSIELDLDAEDCADLALAF
jgi:two-component system, probable response regulator PhcQ